MLLQNFWHYWNWIVPFAIFVAKLCHCHYYHRRTGRKSSVLILNGQALLPALGDQESHFVGGIETVFRGIDDLAFVITANRVHVYETVEGRDLADFGLVQVAAYPRPTATLINALTAYLEANRVTVVNATGVAAPTKLFQYLRFAQAGLPVPSTLYLAPGQLAESYDRIVAQLGMPFVLKALSASGGRHNYLISDEREFARQLDAAHERVRFLAQEFIPNDSAFRLFVFGGEVRIILRSTSPNGSHLTNTEQGGEAALVDPTGFDPAVQRLAVRAASLIGSDVACVNMMQDLISREWYILDANSNPAIATGPFVEDKLNAYSTYLKKRLAD